jgi:hypothetical protein
MGAAALHAALLRQHLSSSQIQNRTGDKAGFLLRSKENIGWR